MTQPDRQRGPAPRPSSTAQLRAVVLVAYGPRSRTRGTSRALGRTARSAGVRLVEVAGFEAATGRFTGLTDRLEDALSACDPGPVLLVHDDVAIDDRSLERLVDAHLAGATVAVPMTNDRGTDHFHGPLPAAGAARSDLKQLAHRFGQGTPATRPAEAIRPACLVADRDTVRAMLVHRIHDPFTMVRDRSIGFVAVEGAFAAHDGCCAGQVRAAASSIDRPVLVASMIVRDEAELLPGCLASLDGLVDRVEVVDTGSTDDTVAIAEAAGAVVTHAEWRDDFAWARNVAADRCRDAVFTLWIDADERVVVEDPDLVRDVLAVSGDEVDAFDVLIANRNEGVDAAPSSTFRVRRIVRSDLLEFSGRVHELPVRRGAPEEPLSSRTLDLLSLDHLGYAAEVIARQDKQRRNLALARGQVDDATASGETASVKATVDLARSIMLAGDDSGEAIGLLRDAVVAAEGTRDDWMAYLLGSLAHLLLDAGDAQDAWDHARLGFAALPTDELVRAVLARSALATGHEDELVALVDAAPSTGLAEPVFTSAENRRVFDTTMVVARARCGDLETAASEVARWRTDGVDFDADRWQAVAEVYGRRYDGMELLDQLLPLVAEQGDAAGLVTALARVVAPELTALAAIGVLSVTTLVQDAVATGLVAAMVSQRWELFDELAPFASALDAETRGLLAARLDERGQRERADRVAVTARSGAGLVAGFGGGRG